VSNMSNSRSGVGIFLDKIQEYVKPSLALPLLVMAAIVMLVIPLPTPLIDLMVGLNLFFALFILLATIYVSDILQFTTFPSILLLTTIFRLAVSISTTRAILSHGNAGDIVRSFGEFVVGDNLIVGLVVFLVVTIVQFMVIMKGGERIAEVSARFVLDALPGKQMSIDADLRSGDITPEDAKAKRSRLDQETQFFGSMDGAMRFVKGDCIASFLIVSVNLIGGLLIGVAVLGMTAARATEVYSILSIGDGLVAQIPSIFSTIAAGILTTRISKAGNGGGLSEDILRQVSGEKRALLMAAGAIGAMGLIPGFPMMILLPLAGTIGLLSYFQNTRGEHRTGISHGNASGEKAGPGARPPEPLTIARFGDTVVGRLHPQTLDGLNAKNVGAELAAATLNEANLVGIGLNLLKFKLDEDQSLDQVAIYVEGIEREKVLLNEGETAGEVATRLAQVVARLASLSYGLDDASQWLDTHAKAFPKLIESVQQQVPLATLAVLLRRLLEEQVPIAHPRAMLTELVNSISHRFEIEELLADCRLGLAPQIIAQYSKSASELAVIGFDDPSIDALRQALEIPEDIGTFDREEDNFNQYIRQIREALQLYTLAYPNVVFMVPASIRAPFKQRLAGNGMTTPVLSDKETESAKIVLLGPISLGAEKNQKKQRVYKMENLR